MCEPSKQCTCNADVNAAMDRSRAAEIQCQPHVYMRPALLKDGDQWCALYGPSIQEGVSGFGDTPEKAMQEFDNNWRNEKITL